MCKSMCAHVQACSREEERAAREVLRGSHELSQEAGERMRQLHKLARDLESKIRRREETAGRSVEDLEVRVSMCACM